MAGIMVQPAAAGTVTSTADPFAVATLVLALLLREAPLRTTTHVGSG